MNAWHRRTLQVGGTLLLSAAAVVGYLVLTHKPGMTVFIENEERRAALKECLVAANVEFVVTERGGFQAKPGSVQRMEVIWQQFANYQTPSTEFCKAQQRTESRY